MNEKIDVLILGELAGFDVLFANQLIKNGFSCRVLRTRKRKDDFVEAFDNLEMLKKEDVIIAQNIFEVFKMIYSSKLIVSFTGKILSATKLLFLFNRILKMPPVINILTGSDITELASEKSLKGRLFRLHLKKSRLNWCPNYPYAIKNIITYKIPNVVFMTYPYFFLGNGNKINLSDRSQEKEIIFFHPSHLDWAKTDNKKGRNSTKGNDRFIKAFVKAIENGLKAKCILLYRGADKDEAKKIIAELKAEEYFIWKPHLSQDEFFEELKKADVIVDQFDVGGFGGVAMEAMSLGKPVMIYIQENCAKLLYKDMPPIFNCHTEEEIYQAIMKCSDREYLIELGNLAAEWVKKNHHWSSCLDQFIFYYSLFTEDIKKDYGWTEFKNNI